MKNKNLILNPYFLIGLFLLVVNDQYLKYEYGNFVTGKLSDIAGLLIFPMFIAHLLPRFNKSISLVVGLSFIVWKTPLVTPLIDFVNQALLIPIHRTVDYTDYMVLPILLLSHSLINYYTHKPLIIKSTRLERLTIYPVLFISFFAFTATSLPRPYEMPKGTVYIGKSYTIKLPKDSIINTIRQMGYNCDFYQADSTREAAFSYQKGIPMNYYQTDNIVRHYSDKEISFIIDTIANIKYNLTELKPNRTKLTIINVMISDDASLQDWKMLKNVSKQYESWLKKNIIEKID